MAAQRIRGYGKLYDDWSGWDNAPGGLRHAEWAARGLSTEDCRQACTVREEPHSPEARVLDALAELAEERQLTAAELALHEALCDLLVERWNSQWAADCERAARAVEEQG